MPLPDERPRQSVANLIGRFELQTKRSSIGSGTPVQIPNFQRVPGITSHATGDSANADEKERRERSIRSAIVTTSTTDEMGATPVKSIAADASRSSAGGCASSAVTSPARKATAQDIPTSVLSPPLVTPSVHVPDGKAAEEPFQNVMSAPVLQAEHVSSIASPAISPSSPYSSTAAVARNEPIAGSVRSKPKSEASPATRASSKTPARPSAVSKPVPASPSKSTPSQPPVPKPLKAQLTGQSTTSNTSTVRARSRASNATSTSIRAKTPSVTPSRSKTPSGLFAPTAASLAKAKNAPAVPTPARKTTTSANANAIIDRLSKPTAASASKARSPPGTPSKTVVKQAIPRPSPAAPGAGRGATVKPRVGLAPARMRQKNEKEAIARENAKKVDEAASAMSNAAGSNVATEQHISDLERVISASPTYLEDEHAGGLEKDGVVESYDDAFTDDTIIHDEPVAHKVPTEQGNATDEYVEEESTMPFRNEIEYTEHESTNDETLILSGEEENGPVTHSEDRDGLEPEGKALVITVEGDKEERDHHVIELEGIVNMLEATNLRPPSANSLHMIDDAGSIPDDEEL